MLPFTVVDIIVSSPRISLKPLSFNFFCNCVTLIRPGKTKVGAGFNSGNTRRKLSSVVFSSSPSSIPSFPSDAKSKNICFSVSGSKLALRAAASFLVRTSLVTNTAVLSMLGDCVICINCWRKVLPTVAEAQMICTFRPGSLEKSLVNSFSVVGLFGRLNVFACLLWIFRAKDSVCNSLSASSKTIVRRFFEISRAFMQIVSTVADFGLVDADDNDEAVSISCTSCCIVLGLPAKIGACCSITFSKNMKGFVFSSSLGFGEKLSS
mmetsp:Transcript_13328/g.19601  ORF Transcript_13328/g.19601 Transcript_13328/m.19601 type:complete len:265 (+) Transcript_13328:111-905(+)